MNFASIMTMRALQASSLQSLRARATPAADEHGERHQCVVRSLVRSLAALRFRQKHHGWRCAFRWRSTTTLPSATLRIGRVDQNSGGNRSSRTPDWGSVQQLVDVVAGQMPNAGARVRRCRDGRKS